MHYLGHFESAKKDEKTRLEDEYQQHIKRKNKANAFYKENTIKDHVKMTSTSLDLQKFCKYLFLISLHFVTVRN